MKMIKPQLFSCDNETFCDNESWLDIKGYHFNDGAKMKCSTLSILDKTILI